MRGKIMLLRNNSRKQQNAEDKRIAAHPQKATNAKQTTQLTVELRIQSTIAECISTRVRGCYYVILPLILQYIYIEFKTFVKT